MYGSSPYNTRGWGGGTERKAPKGITMAQPLRHIRETTAKTESAPREARLELRLTREQKALLVRAAAAQGATLADFVRQAVQDAAVRIVTEYEVLRLCTEDQEAFTAALLAPREPSARLKAACERYREQTGA